jgi:serine/threonine-protein kinase
MPSDESNPTESSPVHRLGSAPLGSAPLGSASSGSASAGSRVDSQQIAEAQTIIRDSAGEIVGSSGNAKQTPADVAKVLLGQRLNHFRIDELIGGGGMGAVFRAHDEQLDRTVAIKVIPFVGDDPDLQRRFRNESQSAAKLDHQRIAKVFDTGRHGRWHYIIFEYIEGINIRDWVHSKGVLSIDDAVLYTCQIADALGHAAQRGITHRDVKPSNVLIAGEGQIKLVDMGLARSESLDLNEDMTASGVTLGTFDYISPEQAHDPRDADLRSDIYSLGCTLYFMLTGVPPYPGGTMLQKLLSHGNTPPPNPQLLRKQVSANLVAVINKMLAKKPSQRYQDANHLIADLREVAARDNLVGAQSIGPVELTSSGPLLAWLEKHLPWLVAAILLVAVALWLRLESAATRQSIEIPASAGAPIEVDPDAAQSPIQHSDAPAMTEIPIPPLLIDSGLNQSTPNGTGTGPLLGSANDSASPSSATRFTGPYADGSTEDPSPAFRSDLAAWEQAQAISEDEDLLFGERSFQPMAIRVVAAPQREGIRIGVDREIYCASLAKGIELAERFEMGTIEIISPKIFSVPIRIDADNLRIQSTVGQSIIVFDSGNAITMQRPSMCTLGTGITDFQNLHFVWDVPEDEVDGGAMFQAEAGTELSLSNSTITINNPAQRGEVYAIDVITDPQRSTADEFRDIRDQDGFPMVAIDFDNVIVRGQATMIHMDYAAKLWLRWNNGLLAVSGRMIDTAGAREPLSPSVGPMILLMTRVTAHAASGICRVRLGASASFPFMINRSARNCVFIVDGSLPHFDFVNYPVSGNANLDVKEMRVGERPSSDLLGGVARQSTAMQNSGSRSVGPLRLGGSSNVYVVDPMRTDPLLRMTMANGEVRISEMESLATNELAWADESPPRWNVVWAAGKLPMISMSSRRPSDYRQDQFPTPGFEEESLPSLPVIAEF